MSIEMHLARLGLMHLINNPEALKSALKEKAALLRNNPHLEPADIATISTANNSLAKMPNKPTE